MIICSNCKHSNLDGAMFCAECGAQLVGREDLTTQNITTKQFEENKLHVLISNMAPFGNILETNINFMIDGLNFLNQRFINNNSLFSVVIFSNSFNCNSKLLAIRY